MVNNKYLLLTYTSWIYAPINYLSQTRAFSSETCFIFVLIAFAYDLTYRNYDTMIKIIFLIQTTPNYNILSY